MRSYKSYYSEDFSIVIPRMPGFIFVMKTDEHVADDLLEGILNHDWLGGSALLWLVVGPLLFRVAQTG